MNANTTAFLEGLVRNGFINEFTTVNERLWDQLGSDNVTVKGTDPFFPVDERKNERGNTVQYANKGITLRTEISARVLAAIASDPAYDAGPEEAADTAVKWADALIARLNK